MAGGPGGPGGMRGGGMGGGPGGYRACAVRAVAISPRVRSPATLIMFSLPLLGGNVLQSLNVTANQFWVATCWASPTSPPSATPTA